jgi:hypothetical protein
VRLAAGVHDVRLVVEGEGGEEDEDALVIEVAPALAGG